MIIVQVSVLMLSLITMYGSRLRITCDSALAFHQIKRFLKLSTAILFQQFLHIKIQFQNQNSLIFQQDILHNEIV